MVLRASVSLSEQARCALPPLAKQINTQEPKGRVVLGNKKSVKGQNALKKWKQELSF